MENKPKKNKGDIAHTIAKAGLSAVPIVGGAATELFSAIISPPLTRRRDEWIQSIANGLKRLEEKIEGFSIKSLSENEMFITTVMHASQVVIRSHQKEKLEALKSAILNAASGRQFEENLQLMFLNFVDTFNPWHLKLLKFLDSPDSWLQKFPFRYPDIDVTTPMHIFYHAFPEMRERAHFIIQLIEDLSLRGLLSKEKIHTQMQKMAYLRESHSTLLGKQFIQFITSPIEEEEANEGQES